MIDEQKALLYRNAIANEHTAIQGAEKNIGELAKEAIPEFHFLNHKVSNFWTCDKSPVGWCVWNISERGFNINVRCHYCGGPVERK